MAVVTQVSLAPSVPLSVKLYVADGVDVAAPHAATLVSSGMHTDPPNRQNLPYPNEVVTTVQYVQFARNGYTSIRVKL